MRKGSLRLRFLAAGAASILGALAIAGIGLLLLFERHVERRMAAELGLHLNQLASTLARAPDGLLEVSQPPADARFDQPLSGLYWQIATDRPQGLLRSRSLWDETLALPPDSLGDAEIHEHTIKGPRGSSLLVVERRLAAPQSLGGGTIRAAVALDRAELHAAGRAFASDLAPSLALLAAVLIGAAWLQVGFGLRPLDALRRKLGQVRSGEAQRLGMGFPDEVRPLAAELDHLLGAQEKAVAQARARSADLAHGLKSSLTVLGAEAQKLRMRGDKDVADEIDAITENMRRRIERELARARMNFGSRTAQALGPAIMRVVDVLRRTPRGQELTWRTDCPEGLNLRMDAQDLAEILGNLTENAAHWATGDVHVSARSEGGTIVIEISDDGPGIDETQIGKALTRGGRLDESHPGTGLGLAIVGDLVEAYDGALALRRSDLGGLLAQVRLPA